jgi:hypothetical protein
MRRWMILVAAALVLGVTLYVGVALALDTLYESYEAGGDNDDKIASANWRSQSFTPSTAHTITEVSLYLRKNGTPGSDLTVEIYLSDTGVSDNKPTGSALAAGTIAQGDAPLTRDWVVCNLSSTASLSAGVKYCIVLRTAMGDTTSNYYADYQDSTSATYGGGAQAMSTDSGATWTVQATRDDYFREYGTAVAPPAGGTHYSGRGFGRGIGRGILR